MEQRVPPLLVLLRGLSDGIQITKIPVNLTWSKPSLELILIMFALVSKRMLRLPIDQHLIVYRRILILGPNNKSRWRQFIYGTSLSVNGAVEIAGVPRAFPFNGTVDGPSTEPTLTSGFPTATTQIITVPATAQIGDFFEITMNYWNTCNPYPTRTPVTEIARIEVVGQPPAPTGTDQTVCNGTTPGAFVAAGVPGGSTVNWYRNVVGSPDTPGTLISSGGSTSLNINAVPGYVNNTTAGIHKVWVSYTPNIANALNCESPKIPITTYNQGGHHCSGSHNATAD